MTNWACVVRGLKLLLVEVELGLLVLVRGWEVRKAREGDVESVVAEILLWMEDAGVK